MRRHELTRLLAGAVLPPAKPGQDVPLGIENADAGPEVGILPVDRQVWPDLPHIAQRACPERHAQPARTMHIGPLRLELAVAVEHLDAVALAVRDVHPAVRVADDVVRQVELAGATAGRAPAQQQLAVGRIFVDAGIAVAVRYVDLAFRRQRGVGAAVERLPAHEGRRVARHADLHQHLPVRGQAPHRVVAVIGAVDRAVRRDMDAVRAGEQRLPPGAQEVPRTVEDHHGVLAAVEDEDVVALIDAYGGDFVEAPAGRQLRPVAVYPILVFAFAKDDVLHVRSPISYCLCGQTGPSLPTAQFAFLPKPITSSYRWTRETCAISSPPPNPAACTWRRNGSAAASQPSANAFAGWRRRSVRACSSRRAAASG